MAEKDIRVVPTEHSDHADHVEHIEHKMDPTAGSGWMGTVHNLGARTVVGVFQSHADLDSAYRALLDLGLRQDDISLVHQRGEEAPPVGAGDTHAASGAVGGAAIGAVLGGIAAGLAAIAIPGIGPLLVAGPIASIIGGALTGGAVGTLVGSFAGLGIPTEHAQRYEEAVRSGGTFLAVKTASGDEAERVQRLLDEHGATQVASYASTL